MVFLECWNWIECDWIYVMMYTNSYFLNLYILYIRLPVRIFELSILVRHVPLVSSTILQ